MVDSSWNPLYNKNVTDRADATAEPTLLQFEHFLFPDNEIHSEGTITWAANKTTAVTLSKKEDTTNVVTVTLRLQQGFKHFAFQTLDACRTDLNTAATCSHAL